MTDISVSEKLSALLGRLHEAVRAARHVLVVSHIDPDGDALGSQLAFGRYLRDIGKRVTLVRDSEIPHKYGFLPAVDSIVEAKTVNGHTLIDTVLALECPTVARMGSASRFLSEAETVISIDHHSDSHEFGHINWVDVSASSVGEMTYEYFAHVAYDFPAEAAMQLYTAILTDTGRFRYQSTSPRTMYIAGDLIRRGADPRYICDQVYFNQRPEAMKLLGMVLNTISYHAEGAVCLLTLTKEMLARSGADEGDSDGMVDYSLHAQGVLVGAILKEIDAQATKVSLRSQNNIDVAAVARLFGGGGHPNAAGCLMPFGLEETQSKLLTILTEQIARED